MATIYIISKDTAIWETVQQALPSDNYVLRSIEVPDRVADAARHETPDLLIVDLAPYGADYSSTCRRVRAAPAVSRVPVLCLVNSGSAYEIAQALDAGGDDCLRKPFVARELAARVRALLRRITHTPAAPSAPLVLNPAGKTAQLYGVPVELTPTEYDLLDVLCQAQGQHLTASDLLMRVWNYPPGVGDPALVRNHVRNLRRKLERDPNRPRIVTSAHGRGYTVSVSAERR